MKLDDEAIDYLEQFIPELAAIATGEAYLQALMSGQSVLIADNGQLGEIFPNGTRKVIKQLEPTTKLPLQYFSEICDTLRHKLNKCLFELSQGLSGIRFFNCFYATAYLV